MGILPFGKEYLTQESKHDDGSLKLKIAKGTEKLSMPQDQDDPQVEDDPLTLQQNSIIIFS